MRLRRLAAAVAATRGAKVLAFSSLQAAPRRSSVLPALRSGRTFVDRSPRGRSGALLKKTISTGPIINGVDTVGSSSSSDASAARRRRRSRIASRGGVPHAVSVGQQEEEEYVLYPSRWAQLAILSGLALISDWVCFAAAAVPSEFATATGGHESATLIDIFLTANVMSCFLYTDASRHLGLRRATVLAATLMAAGCALRSGVFFGHDAALPPYASLVAGTILVGVAQPFFQCAPPLLSATWFAKTERSLATATALNANQLGIAAAFVVGGTTVGARGAAVMQPYLASITVASIVALFITIAFFRDAPPTPPTASAAAAASSTSGEEGDDTGLIYPSLLRQLLFETPTFGAPLLTFVASIGVTNVVSAFAGDALDRASCAGAGVASVGAAFQVAIVLGGIALGGVVDRTRAYKAVTLGCLLTSMATLALLGVAEGYDMNLPMTIVVSSVLALGAMVGPVQPISAELAVEVSHPMDENAVEATQQLAGNLFSALLVPLYQVAGRYDLQLEHHLTPGEHFGFNSDFDDAAHIHHHLKGLLLKEPNWKWLPTMDARGDTLLLFLLVLMAAAYFAKFDFDLKRAALDDLGPAAGDLAAVVVVPPEPPSKNMVDSGGGPPSKLPPPPPPPGFLRRRTDD